MAAEVGSMPVNGNYAPHQGYGGIDHQQAQQNNFAYGAAPNTAQPPQSTAQSAPASGPSNAQAEIPKDEVGWYFVEQYYTTLSRSPEKLYLFYNKRSQFVSGQETDKVAVCIGQRAINDRIKELDFQDCKVRVTNVDSQASDSNIVIQVIGEISNKSQPHKKFTQTFVLAPQNNGYFVLNDIFRYIIEEEDAQDLPQEGHETATTGEEIQQAPAAESGVQEPPGSVEEAEPKTLTSSLDPTAQEHDAKQVDKELEEKVLKDETKQADGEVPAATNGVAAPEEVEEKQAEETPAAIEPAPAAAETTEPSTTTTHEIPEAEKPKDPEPTPVQSPPKQQSAQPAAPPKPAMPKTWATLAAAAHKTTAPAAPATTSSTASTPSQQSQQSRPTPSAAKPAAQPQAAAPTPAPVAPAAQRADSPTTSGGQDEWTAVGGSHNRSQSRQQPAQQQEAPQNRGYIKNVHENVDHAELKAALERHAEVEYLDIARGKNCAFVNFRTSEGYKAAVAANPHKVGEDKFFVEERRIQGAAGGRSYQPRGQGFAGRGGSRGGAAGGSQGGGVGRGGAVGGAQGQGRGGFAGRGRSGAGGRGRGGAQGGAGAGAGAS